MEASKPVTPVFDAIPAGAGANILQQIFDRRKAAVEVHKHTPAHRFSDLEAAYALNIAPPQISFPERLRQSPFPVALMAEIKRASPSKGIFALDAQAAPLARKYAFAGASVISVLTEPDWFKGSIEDLRLARQAVNGMINRPVILRKDFIFDEYQILEARLAGADTILLIVKMLEVEVLLRLYRYSLSLGIEPLVEVQNGEEMATAVNIGAKVIGVNNRNLESFEVDLRTTGRLRNMVPDGTIICALSGIKSHQDVLACQIDGVNAILVGEAIMRAQDTCAFMRELCLGPETLVPEKRSTRLLVKICGTRSAEAASHAIKEGADLIGICLVPGARRCTSHETALAIADVVIQASPRFTTSSPSRYDSLYASDYFHHFASILAAGRPRLVGVFQNQSLDEILAKQAAYRLDIVQLHGDEPIEWARLIPVPVIRCFKPGQTGVGTRGFNALPIIDSGSGSGRLLDISYVLNIVQQDPGIGVILAGGLNPDNVAGVIQSLGKAGDSVIGVDVSSGVEVDGQQCLSKIGEFVRVAKSVR